MRNARVSPIAGFVCMLLSCSDPSAATEAPSPAASAAAPQGSASVMPSNSTWGAAGISGGDDLPPLNRRSQCNRLIAIINRSVKRLQRHGTGKGKSAELRLMADALGQTELEVSRETYDYDELEALRREYSRLVEDTAREARAMAAATRANDVSKMVQVEARLDRALEREQPFMRRLLKFCR